jgi:hypothetical protein
VKLLVGGVASLVAGFLIERGLQGVVVAGIVALTTNLINLFDRAPGRAAKVGLVLMVPPMVIAPTWGVVAAVVVGALLACLPADLGERAMLGDAGANPIGAVAGLGLAVAASPAGRIILLVALLALNAASERWSFSEVIRSKATLRRLDDLGRST